MTVPPQDIARYMKAIETEQYLESEKRLLDALINHTHLQSKIVGAATTEDGIYASLCNPETSQMVFILALDRLAERRANGETL